MGYFGILHQDMRDRIDEEEADYFDKVDVAVRRLLRTVDQILTLSILESGSYACQSRAVPLARARFRPLYEEMLSLSTGEGRGHEFESTCSDVYINVDKYSIGQALRNLLDNAIKFTDAGVDSQVALAVFQRQDHFVRRSSDTGIGMSSGVRGRTLRSVLSGGLRVLPFV
jgi:signal transduction histidine kinase